MELLIVGAGGMGREVFCWLSQEIENKKHHRILGFLDDNAHALDKYSYSAKIVGSISGYRPKENEGVVLAIMDPKVKERVVTALLAKGASFYTMIHPSVITGHDVKIGQGCIISPLCILTADTTIGDFVFLNANTTIGHDVTVGNYCSINGKVEVTGNVKVGVGCLFGVGARIIPSREIGNYAIVGAGSVVIRDIKDNTTVFGNPAKEIVIPREK